MTTQRTYISRVWVCGYHGAAWQPGSTASLPAVGEVGGEGLHVSRRLSHVLLVLLCKALRVQSQNDFFCCFHHGFEDGHHCLHGYTLNGLQRRPDRQAPNANTAGAHRTEGRRSPWEAKANRRKAGAHFQRPRRTGQKKHVSTAASKAKLSG